MADSKGPGASASAAQETGAGPYYTEAVEGMTKLIHRLLAAWFIIAGVAAFVGAVYSWPNADQATSLSSQTPYAVTASDRPDSTGRNRNKIATAVPGTTGRTVVSGRDHLCSFWLTLEERILIIAFLFGVLGGSTHGFASLMNFRGQRRLFKSWTLWYFGRPLIGGMMAEIFYVVVRAGLFSGGMSSNDAVNVYGVAAFSALAGLFTDAATEKLGEIFETVFATKGNGREGKLTPNGK